MRIGLIDVDGHTSKKKWGATIYPNLALCKIARWYRMKGDTVEWYSPFEHYDLVYMSKVFNFSPDYPYVIRNAPRVICGGTGYMGRTESQRYHIELNGQLTHVLYEYHLCLFPDIDLCQPDYSIYPNIPKDYAYGFLTRGCPNKCSWCVVPKKEGAIRPYMDVEEIAIEGRNKLVLMDNNILAASDYAKLQLQKIIQNGYRVDFNQALDARLVTDEFARLLAQVKWLQNRIRFGCDSHAQIKECEKAMDMITHHGYKGEFFLYAMLNNNFKESFTRITYWWEILQRKREEGADNLVFVHAQPYLDPGDQHSSIPQWQRDMSRWVNNKSLFCSMSFEEYEPRKGFKCLTYINQYE